MSETASVFLSYASEDREAARLLRDALPTYGLEVWYDESELGGGDAWDQKIRRQIRECDYFMPVISAQTDRRREGYFRREWRLAVERTLDMADDHWFLLPIVIDDTDQFAARVPEKFLSVQWLRVPGGRPTPAFEAMCRRVAAGRVVEPAAPAPRGARATPAAGAGPGAALAAAAPFPVAHEGQHVRFWVDVSGWFIRSAWSQFKRLPRWVRVLAYIWLCFMLIARCNHESSPPPHAAATVSPADVDKLKSISKRYAGAKDKNDVAKLGAEIAREFADDSDDEAASVPASGVAGAGAPDSSPLMAVAFTAPTDDAEASKFADVVFAMAYGRAAISHRGLVGLTKEPPASRDADAAIERAKASHARYALFGDVSEASKARVLKVTIAAVADGSVLWTRSYLASSDPATIAADIDSHIPSLESK